MVISKVIPLCRLLIDTTKGHLCLKSDSTNLYIKNLKFKNEFNKFSDIIIENSIVDMSKSVGDKDPEITRMMINIYNIIHSNIITPEFHINTLNYIQTEMEKLEKTKWANC